MFRAFVLLAILATVCGRYTVPRVPLLDGRIVGGESATVDLLPYQVSVRLAGSHICGGSIIRENVVVTAAHCILISNAKYYTVQIGVSSIGGTNNIIAASSVVKHPQYSASTIDYDVAVIVLSSPITFSNVAQPVALAEVAPAAGTEAIVSGWGTLTEGGQSSTGLQKVSVQIVAPEQCQQEYAPQYDITERMVCAGVDKGGKDACQGDSGGPLVANGELVGIVSWGIGCARAEYSGVYSNVANLRPWILENSP